MLEILLDSELKFEKDSEKPKESQSVLVQLNLLEMGLRKELALKLGLERKWARGTLWEWALEFVKEWESLMDSEWEKD